jgi:hypothetical protein
VVKLQDISRISLPGLLGSTGSIVFNGQRIPMFQPGLLERCDIAVLDEFFDKSNIEIHRLKSSLSETSIGSELHENRRSVKKRAVVIATSNIPPYHLKKVQERQTNLASGGAIEAFDIKNMSDSVKEEFLREGKNWRDGEDYTLLDRFPFIFYMMFRKKDASGKLLHNVSFDDAIYSDEELHALIYIPELENYLRKCSEIKFKKTKALDEFVDRLVAKYFMNRGLDKTGFKDEIHSITRLAKNFYKMLAYHAMINGRDEVDLEDNAWVDRFYGKTCNFVYTDELYWTAVETEAKKEEIKADEDIKRYILEYLRGQPNSEASLENIISNCVMNSIGSEDASIAIKELWSKDVLIHVPPNMYKLK